MTYDFALKILFTSFTLGCGFKGGEVTSLLYRRYPWLNSFQASFQCPLAYLAAIGFVGVFAGATNTPIACTLMGIELFGAQIGVYLGLSCVVAYIFSAFTPASTVPSSLATPKFQVLTEIRINTSKTWISFS